MTAPAGFVDVSPGWNVWEVWQADEQIEDAVDVIMNAGLSQERLIRIWVENWIKENDSDAAVADGWNLGAKRGDQIFVLPNAGDLEKKQTRLDVPGLAGAMQIGEPDSKATRWFVKFWNRSSTPSAVPWAFDQNHLLETVYQPSSTSPITSGGAPDSLAGAAGAAAGAAGEVLKVVAIVGGVGLGLLLLSKLVQAGGSRST